MRRPICFITTMLGLSFTFAQNLFVVPYSTNDPFPTSSKVMAIENYWGEANKEWKTKDIRNSDGYIIAQYNRTSAGTIEYRKMKYSDGYVSSCLWGSIEGNNDSVYKELSAIYDMHNRRVDIKLRENKKDYSFEGDIKVNDNAIVGYVIRWPNGETEEFEKGSVGDNSYYEYRNYDNDGEYDHYTKWVFNKLGLCSLTDKNNKSGFVSITSYAKEEKDILSIKREVNGKIIDDSRYKYTFDEHNNWIKRSLVGDESNPDVYRVIRYE